MESESRSNEGDLGAEEGKKKEGEQTSERKINEGDEVENEKKKTTIKYHEREMGTVYYYRFINLILCIIEQLTCDDHSLIPG